MMENNTRPARQHLDHQLRLLRDTRVRSPYVKKVSLAAGIQDALHPSEHGILECRLACQSASTLQRFVQALVEPIGIEPRVAKVGRPMQQMDHQMVLRFEALLGPHALQVCPVSFEARLASIDRQDPIMLVPNGDQLLQTLSGQQQANPTIAKSRCVFATFRNQKKSFNSFFD